MKNFKIFSLFILAMIGLNSCETDDDVVFIAQAPGALDFSNSFSDAYILTSATAANLGERFTWNSASYDVPTAVTYELQSSVIGDFTDMNVIGSTFGNEIAVTIGDLLSLAAQAGLDNDPTTEEKPNTGQVWFRLKASIGTTGGEEVYSNAKALTLVLPESIDVEDNVCEFDQLFAVGAGLPTAGWGWGSPVVFTCVGNGVYSGNVELTSDGDANFRFFTEATNWDSGRNYPYYENAGYTIDEQLVNAGDGDSNFQFTGTSGFYNLQIDDVNKTITLGEPQATGTCEVDILYAVGAGLPSAGWGWASPVELLCSGDGIWSGNVELQNNEGADNNFRFFTEATNWDSGRNYPFYVNEGYTIDSNLINAEDGDSNFAFMGTSGTYFLTINTVAKTITLEQL
ncbi:SusE domain-containing protein [Gelidibacter japonicus]|uniref:SusE domain-containing protein n=1 Tax=Gelidibacter japonicus TaxID=1962232 RepID=UPI0013D65DD4|nr:SusE domain-containing protein [Gelidibacter japonicus]